MAGRTRRLLMEYATRKGLRTQGDLARALGVTRQSVSMLIQGNRTMSAETAVVICTELSLDTNEVIRELQHEREQKGKRIPAPALGRTQGALPHQKRMRRMHQPKLF